MFYPWPFKYQGTSIKKALSRKRLERRRRHPMDISFKVMWKFLKKPDIRIFQPLRVMLPCLIGSDRTKDNTAVLRQKDLLLFLPPH